MIRSLSLNWTGGLQNGLECGPGAGANTDVEGLGKTLLAVQAGDGGAQAWR